MEVTDKERAILAVLVLRLSERVNNLFCGAAEAVDEELDWGVEPCYATIMLDTFSFLLLLGRRKREIPLEEVREFALGELTKRMDHMIEFSYLYETEGQA